MRILCFFMSINTWQNKWGEQMKGLIIKDMMCLRKQRVIFIYTVVAVIVLSVMFVLSARFGNIALGNREMIAENQVSEVDVKNLSTMALILFMLIPIALVGDVSTIFLADGKAGFFNVSSTFPLSIAKRVAAKYITVFIMFGIGVAIDLLISFVLSLITDIISFADFFGIIISTASCMSIYGAITIMLCFLFGYGKESYAQICTILVMILSVIAVNFGKIKNIFISISAGDDSSIVTGINFIDFMKNKYYILLFVSIVVTSFSYLGSVNIAKRKRGIV